MPINVGGDGSVIWKVDVKRAKHAQSDPDYQGPPKAFYHEGVEETGDREQLEVTVKLPAGDPVPTISNCPSATVTQVGGRIFITFKLPIEPNNGLKDKNNKNPDQVSIDFK